MHWSPVSEFVLYLKEHQKDSEKIADKKFTRNTRKTSTSEQHKSAITDHVAQENHLIDWEGAKIIDRDSNSFTRKVREAIQIRKRETNAPGGLLKYDLGRDVPLRLEK